MKLLDKEVLFCDNHILVVDKPPLLLTQKTDLIFDSVEERAKIYLKEKFNKPGNVFLHPVHRLDRVASGIVVCARTSKALSRLNESIKKGDWSKIYTLRYEGKLPEVEGELVHFLEKGEFKTNLSKEGKRAHLRYRQTGKGRAEVILFTGRYHQIRAQFAAIGCPICGDYKYGAQGKSISPGIDLHHTKLEFNHPVTHQKIVIESPPGF